MKTTLPQFIQFLLQTDVHGVDKVDLLQTHISYVILAGDTVYKFKKPVDFGFLDFTTLKKRLFFCQQELRLNRRLCPDVYRGLVCVEEGADGLRLHETGGPSKSAVEYGIRMTRMPEERMMANVIARGELNEKMVDKICDILIPFYDQADNSAEISSFGTAEAVSLNILENFAQTEPFVGTAISRGQFDFIDRYARDFLDREELFEKRRQAGRIRDCHGDLYSANICLADQVYIYDCIEFNDRFRYCDVASDVAFLAMDLDFHGLDRMSDHFIDRFCQLSGDHDLRTMLDFYKCYRAYVRGKIGLFTAHAPEVDAETQKLSLAQAAQYFQLAQRYASI